MSKVVFLKKFIEKLKPREREYKVKNRGIYVEAKYLSNYGFNIGVTINYIVKKDKLIVKVDESGSNKVVRSTQKSGSIVPVIDIKKEDARRFFEQYQDQGIQISISEGKIIFTVLNQVGMVSEISAQAMAIDVEEFAEAVNSTKISIVNMFNLHTKEKVQKDNINTIKKKAISMISLFSGCGMLDKGFLDDGGYNLFFALDRYEKRTLKDYHIQTYKENIGNHIMMKDILDLKAEEIPEADIVVAGIPCVSFSKLNTINNFKDSCSNTHPLVEKVLEIIKRSKAKAFLFENVPSFITVKKGLMLNRIQNVLSDFKIVIKKIMATVVGSAQKRERIFIFGMQDREPEITLPIMSKVTTVKDAWNGIENAPQQERYFNPTPLILERMKHIPPGGNILDCPEYLRAKNKKFTNYCQRLSLTGQSPTITHIQDDVFFHPTEERYLSVRETARLFSLPDDFIFKGSLTAIFEMLKNGVDYKVARFLANTIKEQMSYY